LAKSSKRNIRQLAGRHADDYLQAAPYDPRDFTSPPHKTKTAVVAPLAAKTEAQGHYLCAFGSSRLIFGVGPAGTGKTYVAAAWAAQELQAGRVKKIVLTRPAKETGESLGFLPGELEEKYAPYLEPFEQTLVERMGRGTFDCQLKLGNIAPKPLGFMRGTTFKDAVVILDEAQNTTPAEMKMFLTRIGENCTVIVDGDPDQCDLDGPSGLNDALRRLQDVPGISIVEFTEDDIVRSGLIKHILKAYRK
jgi:phosphate starvation-inducible PhoH-like protein